MNNFFLSCLLAISSLLGSDKAPSNPIWSNNQHWNEVGSSSHYKSTAKLAELTCRDGDYLQLPMIIHGSHELFVDNVMVARFGDPTFKKASPFYLKPSIECSKLKGEILEWRAYSYAQYFARFPHFPEVTSVTNEQTILLHEIFNIISGTGILLLCFITAIIFFRKIPNEIFFANILANLGFALYFIFSCSNYFGIEITMLSAHRIADCGVWMGIISFFYILYNLKLVSKISLMVLSTVLATAVAIIIIATDGDTIQFGTSLPFPFLICLLTEATVNSCINLKSNFRKNITSTICVLFFFYSGLDEIALVVGISDSSPFLSVGILGVLIAISLIVQAGISETYSQRDELLNELENKVEERTAALKTALKEKEVAQAELIQNAKLASLGTLSAGIAHEINNNINYVNACIMGLEKELKKAQLDGSPKMEKLISTIKHGTKMTIDIVNSLRNYTGLNQGQFKDSSFQDIVLSVKTIIKRKLDNIQLIENHDGTIIHCNAVALNQVVMNLLTNSIDAIESSKKESKIIEIISKKEGDSLVIRFSDSGTGIPAAIQDKIFDPFFTTKDVGSGTGLGLHIIKKEIENHRGTIKIESTSYEGTTFLIKLPIVMSERAAA